jgi:hypothetical protein
MTTRPPEPRNGQDGPPNTLAVLVVVLRLLDDVQDHLVEADTRPDLLLRLVATRRVLNRLRGHLGKP